MYKSPTRRSNEIIAKQSRTPLEMAETSDDDSLGLILGVTGGILFLFILLIWMGWMAGCGILGWGRKK
jgi:hypothetical protein